MKRKDIFHFILTMALFSVTSGLLILCFFKEVPPSNKEIVYTSLGVFITAFVSSIGWWFNSSKSSAEKTDMIHNSTPIKPEQ